MYLGAKIGFFLQRNNIFGGNVSLHTEKSSCGFTKILVWILANAHEDFDNACYCIGQSMLLHWPMH